VVVPAVFHDFDGHRGCDLLSAPDRRRRRASRSVVCPPAITKHSFAFLPSASWPPRSGPWRRAEFAPNELRLARRLPKVDVGVTHQPRNDLPDTPLSCDHDVKLRLRRMPLGDGSGYREVGSPTPAARIIPALARARAKLTLFSACANPSPSRSEWHLFRSC